jgi:enoyl-CoA hydratase/carnithine racemase
MSEVVLVNDKVGVRTITLNRPNKKNALSHEMYGLMADAIITGEADESIKVTILTGSDSCFTAGNDLGDFLGSPPELNAEERPPVTRFMFALLEAKKPVIAAIEGPAVGIGVTMLLHCEFAYAGEEAYFLTPFVNLALPPEYASTLLLPQMVGQKKAVEMLMLGEKTSAKAAVEMGLVTAVTKSGEALARANETAQKLTKKAPRAIRLTKKLLNMPPETVVDRMNREGELFATSLHSAEFKESVTAFFEKRDPNYSNCSEE